MRAIFLCEREVDIFNVFDESTVDKLSSLTEIERVIYKRADVLAAPQKFQGVEFIFSTWGIPTFSEEEIKLVFPSLKCIFYAAGSVKNFARPFLNLGIKVFSAWAANAVSVAEMAVAQIVLANKGYFLSARLFNERKKREAKRASLKCNGNYGETVGIIGAGMIGRRVIEMLRAYNLRVIVFDPFLPDEKADELGVTKCALAEVFEKAFVVSNHLADNEHTKGMLTYSHFSKMRENAVFINTGRGGQVVEDDLVKALEERQDLTALLDVTDPEPPIDSHPFYTLQNCIMTPHIAGSQGREVARMGNYMLSEFEAYLSGAPAKYEVNLKMLETMA